MPNRKTSLAIVFLYPCILFSLLEELAVQNFRDSNNEHIKACRQIAAQWTHLNWALIYLSEIQKIIFFCCYFSPHFCFFYWLTFPLAVSPCLKWWGSGRHLVFCQMLLWGGYSPPFCLSFFLAIPFHWLFWQPLFEFNPHVSGRKSMPICVFSCSTLDWWRLGEKKKDRRVKSTRSKRVQLITAKYASKFIPIFWQIGWIIIRQMLFWLLVLFACFPSAPGAFFCSMLEVERVD